MANLMARALDKVAPAEHARLAPLDETALSRAVQRRPVLAPAIAAAAITLAVAASFWFGYVAERDALVIDTTGFTVVAGLFVGALAIERLTELLIAPWVGDLKHTTSRSIVIGSVSALLGVLVAGGLGLYLLETFTAGAVLHTPAEIAAASGRTSTDLVRTLDVFVTGMAIAGGTKPLHDLISGLEKRTVAAKERLATGGEAPVAAPYTLHVTLPDPAVGRAREVDVDIGRMAPGASIRHLDAAHLVAVGEVPFAAGSAGYTRAVFDIAYRLAAAGYGVEPELATPAAVTVGVNTVGLAPSSLDRRWALDQMRLDEETIDACHGGEGVVVGHPDTGYRPHRLRPNWDVARGYDFVDDDASALDPLDRRPEVVEPDIVPAPGHGTGTASLIATPRPVPGATAELFSVAPAATIIPYRVMRGPVHLFDSDVARAVDRAVADGCEVISMSLGGFGFRGLDGAITNAVEHGVIVIAAGGNLVGTVVSPADHPMTVAVASSTADGRPYRQGSSQGPEIAVTAPGTGVWRASFAADGTDTVEPGTGTSYATAHVAGLAALWIARHRDALDALPRRDVPRLFACLLRSTARPWSEDDDAARGFGAGLVDAERLLTAPLVGDGAPTRSELDAVFARPPDAPAAEKIVAIAANLFTGTGTMELRVTIVDKLIGLLGAQPKIARQLRNEVPAPERGANVRRVAELEARHHLRVDPGFRTDLEAPGPTAAPAAASDEFAAVVAAANRADAIGGPAALDEATFGDASRRLRRALNGQVSMRGRYRWLGLLLLLVAFGASIGLGVGLSTGDPLRIGASTAVMITAFYVCAQALERFAEFTFGRVLFKDQPGRETERALVLLGITIAIASAVAGVTGFRLLDLLAGEGGLEDPDAWERTLSIFVTGLAIGGGTKPLHDLLTRIRVASEESAHATEP